MSDPVDGNALVEVPLYVVQDAIGLLSASADDRRGATETIEALRKALPPEPVEEVAP